jgi:DNA-binding GntR family transcriptional regulator
MREVVASPGRTNRGMSDTSQRVRPSKDLSRAGSAYLQIRRKILNNEFSADTHLSEYQLAAQLGVSRTPIREALKKLEREGLTRSQSGRGTYVAELSLQDVLEIYEVRSLLEPFAAGVAAKQLSDQEIRSLERDVESASGAASNNHFDEAFRLDVRLHKSLIAATRNGRISQILAQLDDQVHRIRVLAPQVSGRLSSTIDEHRAIVAALAERDATKAEAAMREHLAAARANAILIALPIPFDRESNR